MPARKKTWFLRSRSRANNTSNCVIPFRFSISSAAALSSSSSSSKSRGPNDPSARLSTRTPFDRLCPPHSVSMASPSPSCSCPSSARAICSSRDLRAISVRASVREPLVAFCFTSLVSVCLASAASAIEFMVLLRARSTSSICRMALRICCCGVGLSPPRILPDRLFDLQRFGGFARPPNASANRNGDRSDLVQRREYTHRFAGHFADCLS
mmetsp:Transcript_9785/g.26016  ORF Transcript_9785/g.26016 Transcript_9785/m.26016 type:complete len:211 (-) Transcript_9785:144-776(-)